MINKNIQTVLNSMPECILILDINKKIIWANKNIKKLTNLSTHNIIGKKCYEAVMCTDKKCHGCPFSETLQKKCCEERDISPLKGRRLYVRTTPFIDSNGVDAIMEIIKDCTEEEQIKKEFKENKYKTQKYLDIVNVLIVVLDTKGNITMINKEGENILGYKENELYGKNWFETIIPNNIRNSLKEKFITYCNEKNDLFTINENPIITKNNDIKIITWNNTLLYDEKGNVTGILSSGMDITHLKKQEADLTHRLKLEKTIADISKTLLISNKSESIKDTLRILGKSMDIKRSYIFLLQTEAKKTYEVCEWCAQGVKRQFISSQDIETSIAPLLIKKLNNKNNILIQDLKYLEKIDYAEKEYHSKEGIRSLISVPLLSSDNKLIGLLGLDDTKEWKKEDMNILQIISKIIVQELEKKEILNKLINNSQQFQSMTQNSSDIICLLDKDGIIKYCSPSINRITGYKESEVLERPITDFFHKEDIQIIKKGLEKLIKSPGDRMHLYSNIIQKHKDIVYTEIIATNMLQESSVQKIILNIRDISERRRAEIEQDKLISALKEKNFKLEVFASNLYHNLQSPLSTIGGYTSMLQEALEKENTKDIELCAEIIMKAALQISQHAKSIGHCIREELKD